MITNSMIKDEIKEYLLETGDLRGALCLLDDLRKLQSFVNKDEEADK